MYFTKVELHNFGIYRGTHEMCLVDKTENRNITLVGGLNGRGKTTFHDAILIALYGKQAQKYINEKARSYDRLLIEHVNKHATDEETYVAVSLVLDDGTKLRVERSWSVKKGKLQQQIIVEKDGLYDRYLGENWNYYIEEILPFGIARFFFFNNEKITQLADDMSFDQIKASIKSAIGISTIERAIAHVDEVIKRKEKALDEFEKSETNREYQDTNEQINEIDRKLAEATANANELEYQLEVITVSLTKQEEEFWASGGELSRNREAIKREMQRISAEAEQIRNDILRLAMEASTPLFLCRDLVIQSYEEEKKLQESEVRVYAAKLVSGYQKQILEGLEKLNLKTEDLLSVKELIGSVLNASELQTNSGNQEKSMSAMTKMLYENLLVDVFQSVTGVIDSLIHRQEMQENQRMNLDAHLEAADEKTMAMQLFDALKVLEAERALAEDAYQKQKSAIESLNRQREVLVNKRKKLMLDIAEKRFVNDDNARIIKYAALSSLTLSKFKVRLQREKVARLSETATECFRALVEKDSLISEISIDPESLDVTILDMDGNELLKSQLSAGEQQMFAVSIVWALALTSGYKAPVVIDTPMARLDSSNRANFVTKYLPAASSQVVVLSTDEEITGRYLDMVREHVVNCYTLLYHEDEQYTSIVDGYFGEA